MADTVLEAVRPPAGLAIATDPLAAWRHEIHISRVSAAEARHAVHAYYTATPESPDGASVVFYASAARQGYEGELHLLDRASGEERLLVRDVTVEDTHRAACQQWVSGGRRVTFHDVRRTAGGAEEWVVASVDPATGEERVLARGRQLGWGQPNGDLLPLYGPHWDPAAPRDLELLNVATGERRTVLTAQAVRDAYPALIGQEFGDRPISIFFPALSPDLNRVFFKIATPLGGHYRSKTASHRALLICYDLREERFLFADERWGHPAWHPDSRSILDVPNVLIDAATGTRQLLAAVPRLPGSHPSFSPDGALYVSDVALERIESPAEWKGAKGEWGIVVVDVHSQEALLVDRFDDSLGAESWRRCHPHPVFSAGGQRIYYTVGALSWSQLHVATGAGAAP
jgi:hypothetical protein